MKYFRLFQSGVIALVLVAFTVIQWLFEPMFSLIREGYGGIDKIDQSYRPVAYARKAVTNLYRAQGRTYCWQAGANA